MAERDIFEITPEILNLAQMCQESSTIDPQLYTQYDVKRGLRDVNGKGVVAGLTHISDIISSKTVDGQSIPCEGELYYRGISIESLVSGFVREKRFGFEEITYLILFGQLPTAQQLKEFKRAAILLSDITYEFCQGRYYESTKQRYDEYPVTKCSYSICL